jgi:hypothetical protein
MAAMKILVQKRTSLVVAIVAAFLAGRAVHAGDFVDAVTGPQQGTPPPAQQQTQDNSSFSFLKQQDDVVPGSQQAVRGISAQQQQYQKYIEDRDARKEATRIANEKLYQERLVKPQMGNEPQEAQGQAQAQPLGPEQAAGLEQAAALQNNGETAAAAVDEPPQQVVKNDDSALSSTYAPKLGYPYTQ